MFLVYGPALLEHCFLEVGLNGSIKIGQGFKKNEGMTNPFGYTPVAPVSAGKNVPSVSWLGYHLVIRNNAW